MFIIDNGCSLRKLSRNYFKYNNLVFCFVRKHESRHWKSGSRKTPQAGTCFLQNTLLPGIGCQLSFVFVYYNKSLHLSRYGSAMNMCWILFLFIYWYWVHFCLWQTALNRSCLHTDYFRMFFTCRRGGVTLVLFHFIGILLGATRYSCRQSSWIIVPHMLETLFLYSRGFQIPIKRHIQLMGKVIFLILLSAGICQITTKHLMPPYYSFTEWIYNSILLFVYSILVFFILFAVFCKEFRNLFYRFLIITRHKTWFLIKCFHIMWIAPNKNTSIDTRQLPAIGWKSGQGNFHLLQQLHRSICRVRF